MSERAEGLARELLNYCRAHPEQRFWQALANWSGQDFIQAVAGGVGPARDTWNWKGKGPEEEPK